MIRTKGTDLKALRKLVGSRGREFENALVKKLADEEKNLYLNSLPVFWNPIELQTRVYEAAADLLYPDSSQPMRKLGFEMASETFSGVYKIFLSIPTLSFIIEQSAHIWRQYYEKGAARAESVKDGNKIQTVVFKVADFPELPKGLREVICGYLEMLAQATGTKICGVELDEADPNSWKWRILLA